MSSQEITGYPHSVMAGLDPAIQACRQPAMRLMGWMAASRAAMTSGGTAMTSRGTAMTSGGTAMTRPGME